MFGSLGERKLFKVPEYHYFSGGAKSKAASGGGFSPSKSRRKSIVSKAKAAMASRGTPSKGAGGGTAAAIASQTASATTTVGGAVVPSSVAMASGVKITEAKESESIAKTTDVAGIGVPTTMLGADYGATDSHKQALEKAYAQHISSGISQMAQGQAQWYQAPSPPRVSTDSHKQALEKAYAQHISSGLAQLGDAKISAQTFIAGMKVETDTAQQYSAPTQIEATGDWWHDTIRYSDLVDSGTVDHPRDTPGLGDDVKYYFSAAIRPGYNVPLDVMNIAGAETPTQPTSLSSLVGDIVEGQGKGMATTDTTPQTFSMAGGVYAREGALAQTSKYVMDDPLRTVVELPMEGAMLVFGGKGAQKILQATGTAAEKITVPITKLTIAGTPVHTTQTVATTFKIAGQPIFTKHTIKGQQLAVSGYTSQGLQIFSQTGKTIKSSAYGWGKPNPTTILQQGSFKPVDTGFEIGTGTKLQMRTNIAVAEELVKQGKMSPDALAEIKLVSEGVKLGHGIKPKILGTLGEKPMEFLEKGAETKAMLVSLREMQHLKKGKMGEVGGSFSADPQLLPQYSKAAVGKIHDVDVVVKTDELGEKFASHTLEKLKATTKSGTTFVYHGSYDPKILQKGFDFKKSQWGGATVFTGDQVGAAHWWSPYLFRVKLKPDLRILDVTKTSIPSKHTKFSMGWVDDVRSYAHTHRYDIITGQLHTGKGRIMHRQYPNVGKTGKEIEIVSKGAIMEISRVSKGEKAFKQAVKYRQDNFGLPTTKKGFVQGNLAVSDVNLIRGGTEKWINKKLIGKYSESEFSLSGGGRKVVKDVEGRKEVVAEFLSPKDALKGNVEASSTGLRFGEKFQSEKAFAKKVIEPKTRIHIQDLRDQLLKKAASALSIQGSATTKWKGTASGDILDSARLTEGSKFTIDPPAHRSKDIIDLYKVFKTQASVAGLETKAGKRLDEIAEEYKSMKLGQHPKLDFSVNTLDDMILTSPRPSSISSSISSFTNVNTKSVVGSASVYSTSKGTSQTLVQPSVYPSTSPGISSPRSVSVPYKVNMKYASIYTPKSVAVKPLTSPSPSPSSISTRPSGSPGILSPSPSSSSFAPRSSGSPVISSPSPFLPSPFSPIIIPPPSSPPPSSPPPYTFGGGGFGGGRHPPVIAVWKIQQRTDIAKPTPFKPLDPFRGNVLRENIVGVIGKERTITRGKPGIKRIERTERFISKQRKDRLTALTVKEVKFPKKKKDTGVSYLGIGWSSKAIKGDAFSNINLSKTKKSKKKKGKGQKKKSVWRKAKKLFN
jgi:hypothetical protein